MLKYSNRVLSGVGVEEKDFISVPMGEKVVVIGCLVTNLKPTILPVSLVIHDSVLNKDIFLAKRVRVPGHGESFSLLSSKVVLTGGQRLSLVAEMEASFDAILSLIEGVS